MPIYEFICKKCRANFETLVSIGGEKNVTCIKCGSDEIQKLFSSFGIGGGSSRLNSNSSSCSSCSATSCSTCR